MSDRPIPAGGSTPPAAPLPVSEPGPARCIHCAAPLRQGACPACPGPDPAATVDDRVTADADQPLSATSAPDPTAGGGPAAGPAAEPAPAQAPAPGSKSQSRSTESGIKAGTPAARAPASAPAAAAAGDPGAAGCENCDEPLQGEFCHRCGQSVHNPIRHAGHALEELFESLWHLDGRVFRTLRDLLVPARVACEYLGGHRARYIAPLRLFVVLSVLTFFIGQFTVDFGTSQLDPGAGTRGFSTATSVAEVERRRDAQLAGIRAGRNEAGDVAFVDATLVAAESRVRAEAAARIAALQAAAGSEDRATATGTSPTTSIAEDASGAPALAAERTPTLRLFGGTPWHEHDNPLTLRWLPASTNRWLNRKIGRALTNSPRLRDDAELRKRIVLGSVPTALFVLMPLFALLLKAAYITRRRLYLEHLVVALYSHAFLLLALLTVFVLVGLEHWLVPHAPAAAGVFGWIEGAVWWAMPIYLLIMQKRVYGQGWTMTTLKYFVLGSAYLVLVTTAALFAGFAGLAKL